MAMIHRLFGFLKVVLLSVTGQYVEGKKRIRRYKDEEGNDVLSLDYSSCRIKHFELPQGISAKDVTHLNLEKTNLKAIPPIVFEMSNLKELDLRHNRLTSVPPEISNLHKLKVLKLAMNSLKKLPEDVVRMKSLEVLHLGSNEFTRLPKKFGNLKLKVLWINDNCLDHFPPQITNIKTLEELDAHGNQIKTLPEEIGRLSNLTCFLIHKNRLNALPGAIDTLMTSSLTDFDYHANGIRTFPPGFRQTVAKLNDTAPHCEDTKHRSFRVKRKQTNVKSSKSRSAPTTETAKAKGDDAVDAKTTAVTSETEPSQLHAADQASGNGVIAAIGRGAKVIINRHVYYFNGGHNDCQTTGVKKTAVSPKENSSIKTEDPLNDLLQFTAEKASTDWKNITRKLGFTEEVIGQIEVENRRVKEQCIKAINLWRKEKGKDATVEVLKKALNDAGRKDVVDKFDDIQTAANSGSQDVTSCASGQVEEETSIMEAASCNRNFESDKRKHSPRVATTDQLQEPQAATQPKSATTCTMQPKQPLKERRRRCLAPNFTTGLLETRAQNDDPSSPRKHSPRVATTDQLWEPQAATQPKIATTMQPKQPLKERSRRGKLAPNFTTGLLETRAQKDDPRSLPSTCAQPTPIECPQGRRNRQGNRSFNKRDKRRSAELNQDPTNGRRYQSRPGSNSSAGHETGAPDE